MYALIRCRDGGARARPRAPRPGGRPPGAAPAAAASTRRGITVEELVEVGAPAAEPRSALDGHAESGAADREPEADPERVAVPATRSPGTRRGEVREDRRDHERGDRAQEFDDREDALQAVRLQREARDEQRGCDRGAERQARQRRAEQRQRLVGGEGEPEHQDARRRAMPCRRGGGNASRVG